MSAVNGGEVMENEKEPKGIKVLDRRRFDSVGNERSDEAPREVKPPAEPAPRSQPAPKRTATATIEPPAPEGEGEEEGINFSSFVMSLATQTLMQLGEMEPPPGVEIHVDREAARQTIDILRMLQRRTEGNLDENEAKLIEEILHTLMMSYVKVAQK